MDHVPFDVWMVAHTLVARNATNSSSSSTTSTASRPPVYKAIGISLAVASGLFIGISFVLKKTGLLKANAKYNEEAGEGYGYLKNAYWWSGMTLMILGEICNFVAYAFVDAILVTPLGALSVVITTILSAIFLKERLSFIGKVGCFNCIVGSVVIVMNAPEQSAVADIQEMQHFVIAPGFLSYAGVIIVGCAFIALWVGPRYGKKTMLVYLSICSLIGGLSVVATQGLGSAILAQANGESQFNQWFLYVLLVFVVTTLVTEIIYLNKALNIFNAALVTPTYYVFFTSATIITSAILFQGFKGTAVTIATVIMGFLQICTGVVLLQMSKSAKDVPDAAVFKGDLDQVREIAEVEEPETEPKADAIRGAAALIRRISLSRQKMEQEEARRLREDMRKDQLEPLREDEMVEWDGLRRRKTVISERTAASPVPRRKTMHPPLGMSHFPDPDEEDTPGHDDERPSLFEALRSRAQSVLHSHSTSPQDERLRSPLYPVALTEIKIHPSKADSPIAPYGPGSLEEAEEHIYGLPPGSRKEQDRKAGVAGAKPSPRSKPLPAKPPPSPGPRPQPEQVRRQFSFANILHRHSRTPVDGEQRSSPSRSVLASRASSATHGQKRAVKNATEEERLGLVKGDSHVALLEHESSRSPPSQPTFPSLLHSHSSSVASLDYHHDPYPATSRDHPARQTSLSDSDEDDRWQMPPTNILSSTKSSDTRTITPKEVSVSLNSRQRSSPPRVYQPPPSSTSPVPVPGTMVGGAPPARDRVNAVTTPSGPSPSSSTSTSQSHSRSPDDYETSRKRFEEQSRREREERRIRTSRRQSWKPGGPGPSPENGPGSAAFI